MSQGRQAIEEPRRRDGHTDTRLFCQIAGNGGGVTGVLFMAKGKHPHALGLHHSRKISNGNTRNIVNSIDVVELQRINDKLETIGQFAGPFLGPLCFGYNTCHKALHSRLN